MTLPEAWARWERQQYGACERCERRVYVDGKLCCGHLAFAEPGQPVPVDQMRAGAGPCGPQALFFTFPALRA